MIRPRRDESGAVAVLVGIMAIFLVGMMAFSADLGMAFAHKRQLQTAADAAALGAAGEFIKTAKLACNDMRATGQSNADSQAASQVSANGVTTGTVTLNGGAVTATCTVDNKLLVRADVTGTSPNFFGGVLGKSGDYNIGRTATAIVEPATGVGNNLRPLAVCAADLPATIVSGTPFDLFLPGHGLAPTGSCPLPPNAGNWWTLDCPEESADDANETGPGNPNGTVALENQIKNGCSKPVTIVEGQGGLTGDPLSDVLEAACPPPSSAPFDCLGGDPGSPDAGHLEDAWKELIDKRTESLIPIFCAPSPGLCDRSTIQGTGTNATFPVHKFVGVTICGYHFGDNIHPVAKEIWAAAPTSSSDLCWPAKSKLDAIASSANDGKVFLILVFKHAQVSGSVTPSTCPLGAPSCDTGTRQTRLVE